MPDQSSSRISVSAAALLLMVISLILAPLGAFVFEVVARVTGGNLPPQMLVSVDALSDSVSATAAEFRVDESGAATYTIPLYAVPGTAGVKPELVLKYSSQGGYGPVGKGWTIGGLSSIARCRASREAGDFLGAATPDGSPRPVNFSSTDRFCLDGQRLVPSTASCPAAGGMSGVALATEIETFSRVCAYTAGGSTAGPAFFTVERKDGSISWYGDRDSNGGANRPDGYFEATSSLNPGAALVWAQTRFQDSTGNYIDYHYLENPAGAGTGEHLISEVRYTGKVALPGQSGATVAPYARIVFNYATRPAQDWGRSYSSGGVYTHSRRLDSITSCGSLGCGAADQVRHYLLTYQNAPSGARQDNLVGVQECRDSSAAVCAAPTSFVWSSGRHELATREYPDNLPFGGISTFKGFKLGDINGDGRTDLVYLKQGNCKWNQIESCISDYLTVATGSLDAAGVPKFSNTPKLQFLAFHQRGDGGWHLFDYNGDGLDDLFVGGDEGSAWRVYPSNGITFDKNQNLIANLSPAIPILNGKNDQPQLADLNGDGLTDIVYPRAGALRARIMERQGAAFGWGAERNIAINEASLGSIGDGCDGGWGDPYTTCTRTIAGAPTPKTNFMQVADFNGDAASDFLIRVDTRIERYLAGYPGCEYIPQVARSGDNQANAEGPQWSTLPYVSEPDPEQMSMAAAGPGDPCWEITNTSLLHAFVVKEVAPNAIGLDNYASVSSGNPNSITLADVNGDGLTDFISQGVDNGDWAYQVNTGVGFQWGSALQIPNYRNQARFVDVNGDGRADVLTVVDLGAYKVYYARYAIASGGFHASPTPLLGGNARICEGNGCDERQKVPLFADFDGDGNLDFLSFRMQDNPDVYLARSNQRFVPRDTIVQVVNGLGAVTEIDYAPMTNAAVYRRDTGSRNGLNWGRGSPVMDLLVPTYVVSKAASSSLPGGNAAARARLYYRYAGARVQAGGRGFLGFREITTIDANQSGGHVVSTSSYAQNFPFMGLPVQTTKSAVLNQAYLAPSCLNGVISNACFATPGQPHPSLGGSWFSHHLQSWEMAGAGLGSQSPIHVRTMGTEESLRDPYTGAQTSKVGTAFSYGSYGNVTQTVVDTFTGANTLTSTLITANAYSDDASKWRLGRLTSNTVTHRRPGQPDVVRTTGFSYAMSGAGTGLLTEERVQPGGAANLASTTNYLLDDFGNRVQSTTCAAPATGCSLSGFQFRPSSPEQVKRYSRVEYDSQGRFPVATYEPFWSDGGGTEQRTSFVAQRNVFGDPLETLDVNGVRSIAMPGALGRDYYTWSQTAPNSGPGGSSGVVSMTTYRWCGTGAGAVACPVGAKFRQQVAVTGMPRQWTYFDALARQVMVAAETFNANVIDQDVSAVCTEYDGAGRVARTSNPFFLSGTGGPDGPGNVASACTGPGRLWTTTAYDILGRPTGVQGPDGSVATVHYNGLTTTSYDARNHPTTQVRNGKGEVVMTQDAAGFQTQFAFDAAGNLQSVTRNAGPGAITNTFVYDTLGRKIQQVDPDTGTTLFQYNALGELIAQTDNGGYRIEQDIDARGRVWRTSNKLPNGTIESQSSTTFDTQANGWGAKASETMTGQYAAWSAVAGTALNYSRSFHYDAMGRPVGTWLQVEEGTFGTEVAYDELGRPWKTRDASGAWSKTQFSSRGAVAVCASDEHDTNPACAAGPDTYQRTLATDPWGNVVREIRGNHAALEVRKQFHAQTGRVTEICAGNANCNLVKEGYVWDAVGNLASHQKEGRYLESFTYDSLNRVSEGRLTMANGVYVNQVMLATAYDALGNICSKNGLGYAYPGADGCVGATPMPQSSGIPMLSTAAVLPSYQRAATREHMPFALNRGRMSAPENSYRRYSDDDDRPSWEHEDDEWTLDSEPDESPRWFWTQKKSAPRSAVREPGLATSVLTPGVPITQRVAPTAMAMSSVAASPHAVNQTGEGGAATFYYYDDRGNQTLRDAPGSASDRTIRYSADSKAHEIQMGNGQTTRFWYGPNGQRYKRQDGSAVTLYVDGVEIRIQNGIQTARRYVAGVALQTVMNGVVQTTKYLFHDQLGSLVRIANADGSLAEALDYTAFGDRRAYGNPSGTGSASTHTPRGFTGHEYVDGTQVIHMNGRIYDQVLGRFLQPDPVIQEPGNAQSWNAYTYVFNNPLAYTDPTGNITFRQVLGIVIMVVGIVVVRGMDGGATMKLGAMMAFGFASGYVSTGTIQGGVLGAFTAAITYGTVNAGLSAGQEFLAKAFTGGVLETIQGGKFGHGFASAGLTAAFMPQLGGMQNDVARTATGALIGGTISKATGGKFANGAISGAIQGAMSKKVPARSFNDADGSKAPNPRLAKETMSAVEEAMFRDQAFRSYDTELDAHNAFAKAVRSVAPKAEVGVKIGLKGGKYYLGAPFSIGASGSVTGLSEYGHLPKSTRLVALSHSHPGGPAYLSGTGAAYAYNAFETDNSAFQAWNRLGDGMSAYNEGINVYSFSETDYDYFNYEAYRAMQKSMGGEVPICYATRLGCP
jgi:RHS repeat-associated protein